MALKALLATLGILVWSAGAAMASEQPGLRQISVTGDAQAEIAPDQAVITLGVLAEDAEAARAMRLVSADMAAVIARLREVGVASEDMQTQRISVDPVWSDTRLGNTPGKREITGFAASNTLRVRVRDLEALGDILDDVLEAGANQFRGLSFGVSDPAVVLDRIRGDAVRDAMRKARQLAEAAEMTLGPVRSISEQGSGAGRPLMAMEMARTGAIPVEAGSLSFDYSVSVVFDLLERAPD